MGRKISAAERLLCAPQASADLDALLPRNPDAWNLAFPGLASLPRPRGPWRKLRICIATEEVAGPIRNGGIGSTYAALADLLAQLGHDCTLLYLRGDEIETGELDHWIADYAARGVRFAPVPDYAKREGFRSHSDRWLRAPYNMLRWLQDHPMDVVHVSEWRGCGWLSLQAKAQGLAFADTLFLVKTSSPWMWNRLYGSQPVERQEDLAKIWAERRSVELADVAIGGSLHLLQWMASQGYRIPKGRAFVQPNVVSFENLKPLLERRTVTPGARRPFDEIVFFGRLESRKGLFVFCQAIARLIRQGVTLPRKITFMGKSGGKLSGRPDLTVTEYIAEVSRDWGVEISVLTEFQQYEALEYLLDGDRLAVMPSIIENSSMAIYEAAILGVPCVASDVGGNGELVMEEDWEHVFCRPHPQPLADKLAEAIALGGYVPRPSFDNDANLKTWRDFHDALARGLREKLLARPKPKSPRAASTVSVLVYATGDMAALRATLAAVPGQKLAPREVIVAVDADRLDAVEGARALAAELGVACRMEEAFDLDAGAAFNRLAATAGGDLLLFLWAGMILRPDALATMGRVADAGGAEVLTYLQGAGRGHGSDAAPTLAGLVVTGPADAFYRQDVSPVPLLVSAETFAALEGFTEDYRLLGADHEFVARAQLAGRRCETLVLPLGDGEGPSLDAQTLRGYDLSASRFRAARPILAAAPLSIRDLLLLGKGLQTRAAPGGGGGVVRRKVELLDPVVEAPFAELMQAILTEGRRNVDARVKPPLSQDG